MTSHNSSEINGFDTVRPPCQNQCGNIIGEQVTPLTNTVKYQFC
jgi:hypothetical protein